MLTPTYQRLVGIIGGLILLTAVFSLGWWLGGQEAKYNQPPVTVTNVDAGAPEKVDFSVFWRTWNILDEKFVNGTTTANASSTEIQKRVYGAAQGLTASLGDPYTIFLPPAENKSFTDDIRGDFGGVGIELGVKDKSLIAISALEGTPAKKAGVQAGDRIIKIDGQEVGKMTVDEAVKKIRGEVGTVVVITINRPETKKTFDLKITRATIQIPTLESKKLPSGVFLITLHNFNASSFNLFRQGLRSFVESGSDKLILDLRGNPGGYLEAAVEMASWFLPEGKVVVKEFHGGKSADKIYRSFGYNIFTDKLKMAILIDKGSASASEILAGALSEYGKATLIGESTFGKGSVQELIPLGDGSSVKVTIAKWLTPNDHSISEKGITPQVEVKMTEEDRLAGRDPQLDAAVKFLLNKAN